MNAADLQGTPLGARLLVRCTRGYVEVGRVIVADCTAANDREEPVRSFTNHDLTVDQRLDDPRRGQDLR